DPSHRCGTGNHGPVSCRERPPGHPCPDGL
ncbi:MAG: hypothetical protein AVDCRST_MAG33-2660, partial [uncultured Thermomicrobiales bacterium]